MKYAMMVTVAFLAGCTSNPPVAQEPFFPETDCSPVMAILEAQIARGARADATLYDHHFDATELNTTGRAKLDLMLRDTSAGLPLTVYLDMPEGEVARTRANTVRAYLAAAGLAASHLATRIGPNPSTLHSAAPQIKRLNAMETPSQDGQRQQADLAQDLSPLPGQKK